MTNSNLRPVSDEAVAAIVSEISAVREELSLTPMQVQAGDWIELRDGWYTVTGLAAEPWNSTTGYGRVTRIPVKGGLSPMVSPDSAFKVMRIA